MYDLVVRGGRVVTAGGSGDGDVGVSGGRIVQVGGEMSGRRELDAAGCLVLPGGVDMHVHLSIPPSDGARPTWCDDFESGSAAALAGGITTIGNMVFPARGEGLLAALEREGARAARLAMADYVLHPVLTEPGEDTLDLVDRLAAAGHRTVKMFMVDPAFERGASWVVDILRRAAANGMLTMLHGEDHALVDAACRALVRQGRTDLTHYGESRPAAAETAAVGRAGQLALASGAPVYMVHVSSAQSVAAAAHARFGGAPVYIETRPLYLHLSEERMREPDGPKYVGQPPLRSQADVAAMWRGLEDGTVHTVGSDHAPWRLEDKLDPALDIVNLRPGVANLEWELPMLYSEGVRTGRLSLERMVSVMSTNAAKLFGLYPRKGTIAPGSDADIVVLDPERRRVVGPPYRTRAGYSVFDGWEVTGWPRYTVRRGEVAFEDERVVAAPGSGMRVQSAGYRPL